MNESWQDARADGAERDGMCHPFSNPILTHPYLITSQNVWHMSIDVPATFVRLQKGQDYKTAIRAPLSTVGFV